MTAFAKYKNLSISPRKVRLVADLVRGMEAKKALSTLAHLPKRSSAPIQKLVTSAMNNWQQKEGASQAECLYIKEIRVNQGKVLKRVQPASQGRALPIKKRSSHVEIVIASKETASQAAPAPTSAQQPK